MDGSTPWRKHKHHPIRRKNIWLDGYRKLTGFFKSTDDRKSLRTSLISGWLIIYSSWATNQENSQIVHEEEIMSGVGLITRYMCLSCRNNYKDFTKINNKVYFINVEIMFNYYDF